MTVNERRDGPLDRLGARAGVAGEWVAAAAIVAGALLILSPKLLAWTVGAALIVLGAVRLLDAGEAWWARRDRAGAAAPEPRAPEPPAR